MEKENKKRIVIIISSILASFGLWLYITSTVNPVKTVTIKNVPVNILNGELLLDKGLIQLPNQQITVNITVRGPYTEIYQINKNQLKATMDVGKYALTKGANKIPVEVTNNSGFSDVSIMNNDLIFGTVTMDKYVEKSFTIKTDNLTIRTATGYYSSDPVLNPDKVIVCGASTYVDTVAEVEAKGTISESNENSYTNIVLEAVDAANRQIKNVTLKTTKTEVAVVVKKSKTVPINIKTKGTLPSKYILNSLTLNTPQVEIAGDTKAMEAIKSIDTMPVDLSKLTDGATIHAELNLPEGITTVANPIDVTITVSLNKIIQKNFSVEISHKNLSDNLKVNMSKGSVSIVVQGPESILTNLSASDFKATVDLQSLIAGGPYSKAIDITVPQGITLVSQSQGTVSVTITSR